MPAAGSPLLDDLENVQLAILRLRAYAGAAQPTARGSSLPLEHPLNVVPFPPVHNPADNGPGGF